jgi:hypothetical protein
MLKNFCTILASPSCLKLIYKENLDLEKFFYLYSRFEGLGLTRYLPSELHEKLYEEQYLTKAGTLSAKGLALMERLLNMIKVTSKSELQKEFELWWKEVPESDQVNHFPKTRKINVDKVKCRNQFYALRKEGHSAEMIINGMKNHVENLKMRSVTRNELKYLKNPLKWLKDEEFLAWGKNSTPSQEHGGEQKRLGNVL